MSGTKYLAEKVECFWMMDAVASHLSEIGKADWFVQIRVKVNGNRATMVYEDGIGYEHAREDYVERFNKTVWYEWFSQYYWSDFAEVQDFATKWMWSYNHHCPNMALGGFTPKQRLSMAV